MAWPLWILLVAVWFGLVTGLAEASVLAFQKLVGHRMIFLGRTFVWMAPLADVVLFLVPGLALFVVGWFRPGLVSWRLTTLVFSFLAFLSLLLLYPKLHRYAALVLAAGLAVQASRLIAERAPGFPALVRRSVGWLVALVVGLAAGVHGWQWLSERRAVAQLPPARAGAPNVLLIVLDTVRAHNLSLYGYERLTSPQLARFARTGVRFERALGTSPWTAPTHASLFTGRYPPELSIGWLTPLDDAHPTLAEALAAHGYLTAGFSANMDYVGRENGLARGFAHFEDYAVSLAEIAFSSRIGQSLTSNNLLHRLLGEPDIFGRKTAADVNHGFLEWLSRADRRRPFFVFLNYYDAHEPYLPPEPFATRFGSPAPRKHQLITYWKHQGWRVGQPEMSAREIQAEIDAYDGAIAYLDHQLGLLLDELRARGALGNTLIVVTSDHGEQFGEHGLFHHGNSLYRQLLQVPLLVWYPSRVPAGLRVQEPVTVRDVPATVVDLAGLGESTPLPGTSLARYWEARPVPRGSEESPLLSGLGKAADERRPGHTVKITMSLVRDGYHYLEKREGVEELYDFESDPLELVNLAGSERGRREIIRMRGFLEPTLAAGRVKR